MQKQISKHLHAFLAILTTDKRDSPIINLSPKTFLFPFLPNKQPTIYLHFQNALYIFQL